MCDWNSDLLVAYPHASKVANVPENYNKVRDFYRSDKSQQRQLLMSSGIKTPNSYTSDRFIVRPLRHREGRDYRITTEVNDYNAETHYISPAFYKLREYRVIYVYGNPVVVLGKKPPEGADPFSAWNHTTGARFSTINRREESMLWGTSFIRDAATFDVIKTATLVAADVLVGPSYTYAVTELNFAPSLTIARNIEDIANAFLSARNPSP